MWMMPLASSEDRTNVSYKLKNISEKYDLNQAESKVIIDGVKNNQTKSKEIADYEKH